MLSHIASHCCLETEQRRGHGVRRTSDEDPQESLNRPVYACVTCMPHQTTPVMLHVARFKRHTNAPNQLAGPRGLVQDAWPACQDGQGSVLIGAGGQVGIVTCPSNKAPICVDLLEQRPCNMRNPDLSFAERMG